MKPRAFEFDEKLTDLIFEYQDLSAVDIAGVLARMTYMLFSVGHIGKVVE